MKIKDVDISPAAAHDPARLAPSGDCAKCGGMLFPSFGHLCPHRNVAPIGASV